MKKKTKRNDANDFPSGKIKVVRDFLPSPQELVLPEEETVKVTLSLTKQSVDFFKSQARKHHTKYQKMIRELVDQYSKNF